MTLALSGIKVLDLTRVLAGPFATMILGDLGADIIKVEKPATGDDSRNFGPYLNGESAYFMSINRNKRSLTLNLKSDQGKKIICDLAQKVDVIVENFRPGTMEKLGLGYQTLADLNPRLIYAAVSGFGHSGPYSNRAAYDGIVQAMGGIMSITGSEGGSPTRVGPSIGDLAAGMYGVIGILSAIISRKITGKGQKVDIAMLDCQVSLLENAIARYFATGQSPQPAGNRHSSIVPFEPFATRDGQIMLAAGNDKLWGKFCRAIGQESWETDQRFTTNPLRNSNYAKLRPLIAEVMKMKTTQEWQKILNNAGIPNGPINLIENVINDPQVVSRNMIVEVDHPVAGKLDIPGIPVKLSNTPGKIRFPSPLLGQHSAEILAELLGFDRDTIASLHQAGVL